MNYHNDLIWVEINKKNLVDNLRQLKNNLYKKTKFAAVVKSNAYGHGMVEIAKIALANGADWLAVNSVDEAMRLRDAGISSPILILGYTSLDNIKTTVENDLSFTVYNLDSIVKCNKILKGLNKFAKIHLKFETGTNRQGLLRKDLQRFLDLINKSPGIIIEGMSTHYANIEDTTDHSYAKFQLKNFSEMAAIFVNGYKRKNKIIKHTACSAAIILFKKTYFDMVRAGIGLYGLWPSKETYLSTILLHKKPINLKPVLTWKTKVAQIKEVKADSYISYGCTYKTARKTKLAILPVGYFDGYCRNFSNKSYVLIKNQRAPVCGRVCMNMIIVNVTDIKGVKVEDEVILLGSVKKDNISADKLAQIAGTINYEIVTNINPKIKRVIV